MLTTAATRPAFAWAPSPARSMIAAVAVPVTIPAENPDRRRARKIQPRVAGSRKEIADRASDEERAAILLGRDFLHQVQGAPLCLRELVQ